MRAPRLLPLIALAAAAAGCGGTTAPTEGGLGGTIVVSGSSTVYRISRAAQIAYARQQPGVKVLVDGHGTGSGFSRYLEGEADIIDASRPAKPAEEEKAREKGYDWTRFLVGYDGITVVVNPENTFVKALTVDQLRKLLAEGSTIRKWSELDPSWPDREIVLYTPDNDSGTYEYFSEAVLGDGKARQRKDVQASPDDNILVTGVSGDANALGYFGYAYYAANKARLRAVPVQAGPDAAPVEPSPGTILGGTYRPLSRPLFIYVKNGALRRPEVADFVRYYLDNLERLADSAGYVPPPEAQRAENLERLPAAPAAPTS